MAVRFGAFVFDAGGRERRRDGVPVHFTPKAFGLLRLLMAEAPRVVMKTELTPSIHRRAERLLLLSREVQLRALDALHLATAINAEAATLVTYDPRLELRLQRKASSSLWTACDTVLGTPEEIRDREAPGGRRSALKRSAGTRAHILHVEAVKCARAGHRRVA